MAAAIQRRLLPTDSPHLDGFELVGWSRPARHVGGDYYDFLSLDEGRVGAVLADVSGKGLPAALMVFLMWQFTALQPYLITEENSASKSD